MTYGVIFPGPHFTVFAITIIAYLTDRISIYIILDFHMVAKPVYGERHPSFSVIVEPLVMSFLVDNFAYFSLAIITVDDRSAIGICS